MPPIPEHPDDRLVTVDLTVPEAQLIVGLLKQRMAFIEGQRLLARRTLDDGVRSGSQRKKAVRHVETADEKLLVSQGAYDNLRERLREESMGYEADMEDIDSDDPVGAF